MCVIIYSYVWHGSFICVTWLTNKYMCVCIGLFLEHSFICVPMTHSYVCHDSFLCVPWLIYVCVMTHLYVCHDLLICVPWLRNTVPWLIYMFAMTRWCVCHDSLICVPRLIDMCAMIHWYVCHDSLICVPWHRNTAQRARKRPTTLKTLTTLYAPPPSPCRLFSSLLVRDSWIICDVWHDSFICVPWLMTHDSWLVHICPMTHPFPLRASSKSVQTLLESLGTWLVDVWRDSWPVYMCVLWLINSYVTWFVKHLYVCHDAFIHTLYAPPPSPCKLLLSLLVHDSWLIHMCVMTHNSSICDMTHVSSIYVPWLIYSCNLRASYKSVQTRVESLSMWLGTHLLCVTWLIHMCAMTHSFIHSTRLLQMRRNSCGVALGVWLIYMCNMTHSYVWHDSFICVTWLIHVCDMTHSYV